MESTNNSIYEGYAAEIINALVALKSPELPNVRPLWTSKIKAVVGGIGQEHKFNVCPSHVPGDEQQWLYDLVWYHNANDRLEEVPLVLESEWSMDRYDIRVDFEKLLLANSPLKVMVFQASAEHVKKVFEEMQHGIDQYRFGVASIYILVCYSPDGCRVEIKRIRKEPPKQAIVISAFNAETSRAAAVR